MKLNFQNNIAFQKKLIAKCSVVQNNKRIPCNIFELDSNNKEDICYFLPLCKQEAWRNSWYLSSIGNDLYIGTSAKVYALENENGECLSACEVDDVFDDKDELVFIETAPKYNSLNPRRDLKYAGETMLSFIVQEAKRNKKNEFVITSPHPSAVSFYRKCGFKRNDFDENMSMNIKRKTYNEFVEKNEKHAGKIEYMG